MTPRNLPQPVNLIDALSYIKGCAARQACAQRFEVAFQVRNRTITKADLMKHADIRLAWHKRFGKPDAIEIIAEYGLYRHTVLVEAASFDLTEPAEA